MNEELARKIQTASEAAGMIGASTDTCQSPQLESAKMHLWRVIDRLRREGEEAHVKSVQLQALFNELPEKLSHQADAALEELLNLQPKRY